MANQSQVAGRLRITRLPRGDQRSVRGVYRGLSEESRRLRFLVEMPSEPPPSLIRILADVDHVDHVAYVATVGSRPVGVGRWVRDREHRHDAEAALSVVDDQQGLGVGSLLFRQLMYSALTSGITSFVCVCDPGNQRVQRLLTPWGGVRTWEGGLIQHRIPVRWRTAEATLARIA